MKNYIKGAILIIGAGMLIAGIWLALLDESNELNYPPSLAEIGAQEENIQTKIGEAVLTIDYDEDNTKVFIAEFKEGMTAFDLLKSEAEKANIILKTKQYDFGVLIEAIGEKENGEDGKYWLYYVNGQMPMVSADKNEIKPEDQIEFKFEKSTF